MKDMIVSTNTARTWVLLGVALWMTVTASYVLSSCGRLDTIDSQYKFDITASVVLHGDIRPRDEILASTSPISGHRLAPVLAGTPLAAMGLLRVPSNIELAQFLWCITTALIAALIPPTLFWAWKRQGIGPVPALIWACVAAFATLLWPTATSSFDQPQRAWFLLVAVLLTNAAVEKRSFRVAFLAGVVFSVVPHYQPGYAVLALPILVGMVPWTDPGPLWRKLRLSAFLCLGALPGMLAWLYSNYWLSAVPVTATAMASDHSAFGSPIIGSLVLLVSPGKGILFFTPVVLIALLGFREMWQKHRCLALLIGGVCATQFAVTACLSFPGGDWCWGPRYLVVTLPLWSLLLPYGAKRISRLLSIVLVSLSLVVQVLGISLDHQRFYFEHNLPAHFWLKDPMVHFRYSQLISRPGEIFGRDVPNDFPAFSSSRYGLVTYAPMGLRDEDVPYSSQWVRQFAVFYWPRPWPLWVPRLGEKYQFVDVPRVTALLAGMLGGGILLGAYALWIGARRRFDEGGSERGASRLQ